MGERGTVDISGKSIAYREAVAEGYIRLRPSTIRVIREKALPKGDLSTALTIAAVQAAKSASQLIPYTHPIPLDWVWVEHSIEDERIRVRVTVRTVWKTGVEMEALAGVAGSLLTVWDMVKKYEKDENGQYPYTIIENIRVVRKEKRG